ncbi:hypothetical protein EVAR_58868_1 [Eumeta japonica]|uniref:Uncharacterized protein n=1 Tax=Eumeta variegata TaxID=151549 RepID=A0A4C1Y6B7_EUMVA|nr:hypothetical protein EVAR_58868_1 [Eumeta japonica]
MKPEGRHRNSITESHILVVFELVRIVLRCTLPMSDFQDLMMEPEDLENSRSEYILRQLQQAQTRLGYVIPLWSSCVPFGSIFSARGNFYLLTAARAPFALGDRGAR